MKKALITGISGFVGSHLTEFLLAKKIDVYGIFREVPSLENIKHLKDKIHLTECDLENSKKTEDVIDKIKPYYVFHLAAFSSPAQSFQNPTETLKNNIFGELNLLEALQKINSKSRILIVGSADEYGDVEPKYLPVKEDMPFSPASPYAVSKVAQDMLGLQYFLHYGLHIVRVRSFNHIGPRQSQNFVVPAFASQIAHLEKQGGGIMKIGNIETYRDFTDVRDIVRAYYLALEYAQAGEVYNIGSAKAVKIADVLDTLLSFAKVKIKVVEDKARLRPADSKIIYCDYSKFKKQTGWHPQVKLSQTLFDTIEYERKKLSQSEKSK